MSGILVTRTGATFYEASQSQTRIQEWRDVPNGTFTRTDLIAIVGKVTGVMGYLIAPFIMLFMFVFWGIAKLIYLAIVSLLVKIIALIGKRTWSYGEIFTVGLFALTLPTLLKLLLHWVYLPIAGAYTLILGGYMIAAVFLDGKNTPAPTPPATTPSPPSNPTV